VHWKYDAAIDPLDYEAFVYVITNNLTGQRYIGRKYVYRKLKGKLCPSKWESYCGSSVYLTADIKLLGVENFSKEITHFCRSRRDSHYVEEQEQFACDVLRAVLPDGSRAFYNRNIGRRHFYRQTPS